MTGRFSTRVDREDGTDLRTILFAGREVAARVYFAIRDEHWRTVPLLVDHRLRTETENGFVLDVTARADELPVDVVLRYEARGNELTAEVTATTRGPLRYCRIGFCVLLDEAQVLDRDATSLHDGVPVPFRFSREIVTHDQHDDASDAFHHPFDELRWTNASGIRAVATFDGEPFEFEDQRNWTDPSFKAYSVAPTGGWPVDAPAEQVLHQAVCVRAEPVHTVGGPGRVVDLTVGDRIGTMPRVGLYRGRVSPRSYRPGGGFQEFNAQRPDVRALGAELVELAVNGAVHAADDDSVMDTTRLHGAIVAQAATLGGLPVVLGPVGFLEQAGDWRDASGGYSADPPSLPAAERATGRYGASWILASAASAAPAGPQAIHYALDPGARSLADEMVARLAELEGRPLREVGFDPEASAVAALAVELDDGVLLGVVGIGPDSVEVRLPSGEILIIPGFGTVWTRLSTATTRVDPPGLHAT